MILGPRLHCQASVRGRSSSDRTLLESQPAPSSEHMSPSKCTLHGENCGVLRKGAIFLGKRPTRQFSVLQQRSLCITQSSSPGCGAPRRSMSFSEWSPSPLRYFTTSSPRAQLSGLPGRAENSSSKRQTENEEFIEQAPASAEESVMANTGRSRRGRRRRGSASVGDAQLRSIHDTADTNEDRYCEGRARLDSNSRRATTEIPLPSMLSASTRLSPPHADLDITHRHTLTSSVSSKKLASSPQPPREDACSTSPSSSSPRPKKPKKQSLSRPVPWSAQAALEAHMYSRPAAVTPPSSEANVTPLSGDSHDKPAVRLKPGAVCDGGTSRRQKLLMGHPWVFDHEIQNISDLGRWPPGTLVDVVESDGSVVGVGLLNRRASVTVRLVTHTGMCGQDSRKRVLEDVGKCLSEPVLNSVSSPTADPPGQMASSSGYSTSSTASSLSVKSPVSACPSPVSPALVDRLCSALRRRCGLFHDSSDSPCEPSVGPPVRTSLPSKYSPAALKAAMLASRRRERPVPKSKTAGLEKRLRGRVWRGIAGEADGVPGVEVDIIESGIEPGEESKRVYAVVRLHAVSARPFLGFVVDVLREHGLSPSVLCVQHLRSHKEKLAEGGGEYSSELLEGNDPLVWFRAPGLPQYCEVGTNLFFPPFVSYPPSASRLQRFCSDLLRSISNAESEPLSVLAVRAGPRAIGMLCAMANKDAERGAERLLSDKEDSRSSAAADTERSLQRLSERRVGRKVGNVVILEEAVAMAELADSVNRRNGVADLCTVFHRLEIGEELKNMVYNHLRFHLVYIHFPPVTEFSKKQRHGQFGRWFRPSLKGVASTLRHACNLLQADGYLVVSIFLPQQDSHSGLDLLRTATETSGRKGFMVAHWGAGTDTRVLLAHDDCWYEHTYCIRLG
ncbi:hypothetical protein CSUI_007496 [Cystoisospora suis]|uniref:RlmI-like PUA domain-containing protein n=1 Tax=Cystoisospora suis TaxID=483139 RepID=A0A2C6KQT1_9APIC|nr:hypothetical protein CSUI_007496 [Cystoisospora suis]